MQGPPYKSVDLLMKKQEAHTLMEEPLVAMMVQCVAQGHLEWWSQESNCRLCLMRYSCSFCLCCGFVFQIDTEIFPTVSEGSHTLTCIMTGTEHTAYDMKWSPEFTLKHVQLISSAVYSPIYFHLQVVRSALSTVKSDNTQTHPCCPSKISALSCEMTFYWGKFICLSCSMQIAASIVLT